MSAILIAGREVDLPGVRVLRFDKSDGPRVPEFKAGDGYNKPRVRAIDSCVWHWTGGEGDPIVVAETLRRRKLGVEFAIARDGALYQFCDPCVVDTADAGILNSRSVGVEIVNYGYAGGWTFDPVRAVRVPLVPKLGKDRETYEDAIHGKTVRHADFYAVQNATAMALAQVLSDVLPIPRVVPLDAAGFIRRALTPAELSGFKGHLGHYHITTAKRDPGTRLIERIAGIT